MSAAPHSPRQRPRALKWIHFRILVFAASMLLLFALVLQRAYRLQVGHGARLREMAQQQYLKQIELPPRRGTIYDARGAPLALSVDVDSVAANPRVLSLDKALTLGRLLGLSREVLARKLQRRSYFVWLKRRITPQLARKVRALKLPGVSLQKESRRFYPNGPLASTVVGFSGIDGTGLEGLERTQDSWLKGSRRRVEGLRDALGRPVMAAGLGAEPTEGHDVVLTLDKSIQFEAEQALEEVVQRVDPQTGWAAAVVMDPRTGDVLAMATKPSFDPNRLGEAPAQHRRNRAMTDAFEPGSTIKVFSVAAALEAHVVQPDEQLDCHGGRYRVGRHTIHDTKPHGMLSVAEIIKKSSNIGVSQIAARLGKQRLYDGLRRFGFASRTGLPLPGERSGVLRDPKRWSDIGLANIAFGQGMTATALQLATALSAVGNGGTLMQPHLVLRVRGRAGNVVKQRELEGRRVMSKAVSRQLIAMMRGVTQKGGTGTAAALKHYSVAGKTGTAQKVDPETGTYSRSLWLSSFMGLVPATRPRLAIVVVVNEPKGGTYYGGAVAGPVFRRIARQALSYLGVPPDLATEDKAPTLVAKTETEPPPLPEPPPTAPPLPSARPAGQHEALVVPDFTGMSLAEVVTAARKAGVEVRLLGSGTAVVQSPGPGAVPSGTVCRVSLRPAG